MAQQTRRALVIGAGIGGLSAALALAAQGIAVTVLEKTSGPGGKMREAVIGERPLDVGPTVMTLRSVFDELFAEAGEELDSHVRLVPCERLARHAWDEKGHFDLFADRARSADAIAQFFGPEDARNYLAFCAEARAMHAALDTSFMRREKPSPLGLARLAGLRGLLRMRPFDSYWSALTRRFADQRLAQLFGRYATYCGSSPYSAPATLMLIAHVEQEGVWLVQGGMHRLAVAMARLIETRGGVLRYGARVAEILASGGRASGVRLCDGERIDADIVISNVDANAIATGLLGDAPRRHVPATARQDRALSAVTFALSAYAGDAQMIRHNVYFSQDYRAEFDDIAAGRTPRSPTVYVCAQDRNDAGAIAGEAAQIGERLFMIVNAPPDGDGNPMPPEEITRCAERTFGTLARCGLNLTFDKANMIVTTPQDYEALFPATGGALYGRAMNGPWASFQRSGTRTRLPGLYLSGGSVHPGAGVPMVALSGLMAARAALADLPSRALVSMSQSRPAAMPGGISTG